MLIIKGRTLKVIEKQTLRNLRKNLPEGRNDRHNSVEYRQKVEDENVVRVLLFRLGLLG